MEQILSYHDLWELVTETTPKDDPMTNDYKQKNKNALLLIFALEDDILLHIRGLSDDIDL